MGFSKSVFAALCAAAFLYGPSPAVAQSQPQAEQKQESQSEEEYKKPRRAPRPHVHYPGDGHDHSKDMPGHSHSHAGHAHKPGDSHAGHEHETFDVEALMAFTAVSRIGDKGDKHIIASMAGGWGKHDGSFRALTPSIEFGFNPHERLHVALEVWGDHFKIRNVTDLDDQKRWGAGAAIEFKVSLVRRGSEGPVGVTLIVAPHYSNSEEASGEKAHHWSLDTKLVADVELIRDMLLFAVNLNFETARVRARGAEEWEQESTFGVGAALMARVTKNFLFGIEAEYLRAYGGSSLNTLAGRALYVGPTAHFKIDDKSQIVAGWLTQVSGKAVDDPRSLDLVNFERNRARVFYSKHF